jgi:DNA-binding PadR family transcriptional regulator
MHGYDLHSLLKLQGVSIGTSRLYSVLEGMKNDGLLLDRWEKSTAGPKKRIYSLSDAGHKERSKTLLQAIEIVHEFYLDYLESLPPESSPFKKIYKKLSSLLPENGTIVCLFSVYNSPLDMILRGFISENPNVNAFVVTPDRIDVDIPEGWKNLKGSCDDIPLKDGFVDVLFIAGFRNEFAMDACLSEWERVLSPEGHFSMVAPHTMIDEHISPLSIGDYIEAYEHHHTTEPVSPNWSDFRIKIEKMFPEIKQVKTPNIIILNS